MAETIRRLFSDEEGATALEYALMAAAIAGVIIAVAFFLGNKVKNQMSNVASHF